MLLKTLLLLFFLSATLFYLLFYPAYSPPQREGARMLSFNLCLCSVFYALHIIKWVSNSCTTKKKKNHHRMLDPKNVTYSVALQFQVIAQTELTRMLLAGHCGRQPIGSLLLTGQKILLCIKYGQDS